MLVGKEKIVRERVRLLKEYPHFGYIALNFNLVEDKDTATMAVDDQGNLYFNSRWVNGRSEAELLTTLTHEVLHIGLLHPKRKGNRNALVVIKGQVYSLWNVATDLAVNSILIKERGPQGPTFTLPEGALVNPEYEGKTAEEIYTLLEKKLEKLPKVSIGITTCPYCGKELDEKGRCPACKKQFEGKTIEAYNGDKGGLRGKLMDEHIWDGKGQEKRAEKGIKERQIDWHKVIQEAKLFGLKKKGDIGADLEREIELLTMPKLTWADRLKKAIVELIKNDYTWLRPAKSYYSTGIYLPAMRKSEGISCVIAIDTSGSISQEELNKFITQIAQIAEEYQEIDLKVIDADAKAYNTYEIRSLTDLMSIKKVKGGGGTDFRPAIEKAKEYNPKIMVYFTDLMGEFPKERPPFDIIWVVPEKGAGSDSDYYHKAKELGEVIRIEG